MELWDIYNEKKEKTGRRTAIILSPVSNYISVIDRSRNAGIQGMGENGRTL